MGRMMVCLAATVLVCGAGAVQAAPVIVAGGGIGVTTDLFDVAQGAQVVANTPTIGPFIITKILGFSGGGGEDGRTTIFLDASGGGGFVDFFEFRTLNPIVLKRYELLLDEDGNGTRSTRRARLFAGLDGITFTLVSDTAATIANMATFQSNFGSDVVQVSQNLSVLAQFFRLEVTRDTNGSRIRELDGFGASPVGTALPLHTTLFNAATNVSPPDEAPGLATNFTFSSAVGNDTVQDAFGNNNGTIEPTSFIFGDGGVTDNGNAIMGDGGETVDFIDWDTLAPVGIQGYEISMTGDGGGAMRSVELVRFLVEGVQVDFFDNNRLGGTIRRLFAGPVTGDDFRIEFTRGSPWGPRILEINAILTPEPTTMTLLVFGTGLLAARRRRKRA